MHRASPAARPSEPVGQLFRRALAESHLLDELAVLDSGGRPTIAVRENPDLFRAFAAGDVSPDTGDFLFCAQNIGLETHPAVFSMMSPRLRRIVRDSARRNARHIEEWAAHRQRDNDHWEERGYSSSFAESARADTARMVCTAHEQLARVAARRPRISRRRPVTGSERPAGRRQKHVARSTSSSDPGAADPDEPEPPTPGRLCGCGCGRDISHKRADSRTFDQSCRKRLERQHTSIARFAPDTDRWQQTLPLAAMAVQVERDVADGELAKRTGRQQVAALVRARHQLLGLDVLGAQRCAELHGIAVFADPDGDALCLACGRYRGKITARVNGFDLTAAVMASNGRGALAGTAR
jgi:hypothetical protein